MKAASLADEAAFIDRRSRFRWLMKPPSLKTHILPHHIKELAKFTYHKE